MNNEKSLKLWLEKGRIEAGCDEAGRGCLAGPVVAAAVILPLCFKNEMLNDSKKLTENQRYKLRTVIEAEAVTFAIGVVSSSEIDEINILNASFLAMHRAIDKLETRPEHLLIDGNRFNAYPQIKHTCIVKGDSKFLPIAAASVLAKTYRDDLMSELYKDFPAYGWNKNKGYPTAEHRNAIFESGSCIHHRLSFTLLRDATQLKLDF